MLVLSRRVGEEIVIDGLIRIVVASVQKERVCLAICAPASMRVDRKEVHENRLKLQVLENSPIEKVAQFTEGN